MIEKKIRKCAVCRQEYTYCPRCREDKNKPTWYFAFCSSNCKDIYTIASKFENEQLISSEAKKMLSKLDLSKMANFGESYKNSIKKINAIAKAVTTEEINTAEKIKQLSVMQEEAENKKSKRAKKNIE